MPGELFANVPSTTATGSSGTTSPASGTTETWTVASSAQFPAASSTVGTQFHIGDPAAPSEMIAVTNVSGINWTVTRGAEGSTPVAHATGATYVEVTTAGFLRNMLQFVPTAVKTGNYTVQPGDWVPFSTASGALTLTLPQAPGDGTTAGAKMISQGTTTNAGTIVTQGSDVFNVAGGVSAITLSLLNQGALLRYSAAGTIWYAYADDIPLAAMDGRYLALTGGTVTGNVTIAAGNLNLTFGSLDISFPGTGLKVAEGANAKQGTVALNGTTAVVVSNTNITANSRIFLTNNAQAGSGPGVPYVSARSAGTSFSVKSTVAGDTSVVAYEVFEPG